MLAVRVPLAASNNVGRRHSKAVIYSFRPASAKQSFYSFRPVHALCRYLADRDLPIWVSLARGHLELFREIQTVRAGRDMRCCDNPDACEQTAQLTGSMCDIGPRYVIRWRGAVEITTLLHK